MKKILVIQTAFPGDAILTLPMIRKMSENFPGSKIDVIAIPSTSEIFKASPYVNSVIEIDKKSKDKSLFSTFRIARDIRKQNYDLLVSPHRSFRTALIVLFSRVKNSVGFSTAAMSWVYGKKIAYLTDIHEVQRNLALIDELNSEWRIKPEMNLPEIENYRNNFHGAKIIAIAPGSVWETKKYPSEYFREIVNKLVGLKIHVILLGSDKEKPLCESLNISSGEFTTNMAGKLSILESTSLLRQCNLLVSNDSAPTHMGMAADIPVLTIYCSTVPQFGFYPYNSKSTWISYDNLLCKPCGIHGHRKCPETHFNCAKKIQPGQIIDKILELIYI